jgi:hypothetical protein
MTNPPKYYSIGEEGFSWTLVIAYKQNSYRTKAVKAFAEIVKKVISEQE